MINCWSTIRGILVVMKRTCQPSIIECQRNFQPWLCATTGATLDAGVGEITVSQIKGSKNVLSTYFFFSERCCLLSGDSLKHSTTFVMYGSTGHNLEKNKKNCMQCLCGCVCLYKGMHTNICACICICDCMCLSSLMYHWHVCYKHTEVNNMTLSDHIGSSMSPCLLISLDLRV